MRGLLIKGPALSFRPFLAGQRCGISELRAKMDRWLLALSRLGKRGGRVVTNVGRDAMDAGSVETTSDAAADGEIVWSWRSDAGAKVAGLNESGDRRWQPSMVTGEITYKP